MMTDAQARQWSEITAGLPRYKGWAVQAPDSNGAWWEGYKLDALETVKAGTRAQLYRAITRRTA